MKARKLRDRFALGAIPVNGFAVDVERLAADVPAFELGAAHTATHPFDDQVAFQFGDRTDDDDDGAPERATTVDVFPEADELDIEVAKFIERLQEVADR